MQKNNNNNILLPSQAGGKMGAKQRKEKNKETAQRLSVLTEQECTKI